MAVGHAGPAKRSLLAAWLTVLSTRRSLKEFLSSSKLREWQRVAQKGVSGTAAFVRFGQATQPDALAGSQKWLLKLGINFESRFPILKSGSAGWQF